MKPTLWAVLAGGILAGCTYAGTGSTAIDREAVEAARADACEAAAQTTLEAQIWAAAKPRPADALKLLDVLKGALEIRCDADQPATSAGNGLILSTVGRMAAVMAKN